MDISKLVYADRLAYGLLMEAAEHGDAVNYVAVTGILAEDAEEALGPYGEEITRLKMAMITPDERDGSYVIEIHAPPMRELKRSEMVEGRHVLVSGYFFPKGIRALTVATGVKGDPTEVGREDVASR